ncbi:hypothetical protein SAMN05444920_107353 [Nonomuraea solani]|uniref:Uncharacterized protein n=1 Tax=Nonomuraea solani TaxID=1144553 RepID=A0A1H6E2N0_9ACTN|nr:hypothetical protein [Nonomuraea solani]SEG91797.1 hypothetical protein SAMN05444920_107353 [Nonomuraea solani]
MTTTSDDVFSRYLNAQLDMWRVALGTADELLRAGVSIRTGGAALDFITKETPEQAARMASAAVDYTEALTALGRDFSTRLVEHVRQAGGDTTRGDQAGGGTTRGGGAGKSSRAS